MKQRRNDFLGQLRRAQEAKREPVREIAPERMSGEELEDAITAARRELLDAQHAELREREKARVSGERFPGGTPEARGPREPGRQFIPQQRAKHWRV